jgi:ABC-type xylose transport system substrate-binding protein
MVDGFAGTLKKFNGTAKVGFAIYNGTVPRWNRMDIPDLQKCLDTYAPNVEMVSADPKGEAQRQTTQVQGMISQGINVLLMTPVVATPTAIFTAARENNVKIINYANPVIDAPEGEVLALIGDGPEPVGKIFAEWVESQGYPAGTEVALVVGDLATQYAQLMQKGAVENLQDSIDSGALKLVGNKGAKNYDPAEAEKIAQAILVANPNVKAFMVGTAPMADSVIKAIKAAGKEGQIDVMGLDADPVAAQNLLLGTQKAAIVKNPHDEMKLACVAVIAALNDDPIPTDVFDGIWDLDTPPMPYHDVPLSVITKETLQEAIDADVLTKEEACEGIPATEPFCA